MISKDEEDRILNLVELYTQVYEKRNLNVQRKAGEHPASVMKHSVLDLAYLTVEWLSAGRDPKALGYRLS